MPGSSRSLPTRLRKFLTRRPSVQLYFVYCLLVVVLTRMGLSLLGYRRIRHALPSPREAKVAPKAAAERVAWGVGSAARLVPGASCLTQALAGQFILGMRGYASAIRIGVKRGEGQHISAHAWLISGGRIVLGGGACDVARFTHLTDLTGR
jgi:hypothetical protein